MDRNTGERGDGKKGEWMDRSKKKKRGPKYRRMDAARKTRERGDGKTGEWMDRIREKEVSKRWEKEETEGREN
jgi:hypothetical protein